MRIALGIAVAAMLIGAPTASAQSIDGTWWLELATSQSPGLAKAAYVRGLFDGARLFGPILVMGVKDEHSPDVKTAGDYMVLIFVETRMIALTQVRDGLDVLYGDFRNRKIDVALAAEVVVEQIAGVPESTTSKRLEELRANALTAAQNK